ncbi:MAG TPA: YihY/virulence factor BrkB family protein [Ilumatobacter sp.]|nr:YihY/virulence factor BrkB family protein [Ilumatobacter sp.]
MPWTEHPRVVVARQRWMAADLIVGVADGFRRHLTGRNAAVLAYYGVLTLFPLLMAATTILGFVLEGRPDLQRTIVDSALAQIPVVGGRIQENAGQINGNWIALVVGLGAALWGSSKAFVGAQSAFDDIWEVPVDRRANLFVQRGRALIGVTVIGLAQVGNVALAAIVGYAGLPRLGQVAITLGGLASNVLVLATMYRFLTAERVDYRQVWPGAVLGGMAYTVLQYAGTNIMTRAFDSAQGVYGDFAGLLALMSWISIHALIALVGAELNAAVADRRARLTALTTL